MQPPPLGFSLEKKKKEEERKEKKKYILFSYVLFEIRSLARITYVGIYFEQLSLSSFLFSWNFARRVYWNIELEK